MMNNFGTKEKLFYEQELRNMLKDCYEVADYKTSKPNSFESMLIVLPITDFTRIKYDELLIKIISFLAFFDLGKTSFINSKICTLYRKILGKDINFFALRNRFF